MSLHETLRPGMQGAFYGRYSTNKQEMLMQQHSVNVLASKYECQLIENYLDKGVSARKKTIEQRKELQRLLNDASSRKFDFVIVYKGDRLARNPWEHQYIRTAMKLYGIPVIESATETLYTDSKNIIVQLLQDGLSKLEVDRILERTRHGIETKAGKGYWMGGKAPYGYRYNKENHTFVPYPEEIEIVKLIFSLYKKAEGFDSIASQLSEEYPKSKWTKEKIKRIVTNPIYSGYIAWGKIKPTAKNSLLERESWIYAQSDLIEPIISKEEWEFCWKLYQQKRQNNLSPKRYKTRFLLKDIAHCKQCNKLLETKNQQTSGNNGKKYGSNIYFCVNCKLRIEADVLHTIVDKILNDIRVNQPEQIYKGVKQEILKHIQQIQNDVIELENALGNYSIQINQVEHEIRNRLKPELIDHHRKFLDILTTYRLSINERMKQTKKQIEDKNKQIVQMEQVDAAQKTWDIILQDAYKRRSDIAQTDLRRLLIHLVAMVSVDKNNKIDYQLRHNLIRNTSSDAQLELQF